MRDEETGLELAAEIERMRSGGSRWECPAELRERVVAYAAMRRSAGVTLRAVAQELGLSRSVLSRWVARVNEEPGALVPVRVSEVVRRECPAPRSGEGLVLVSPRGYQVQGLDLGGVAALLERLG